MHTSGPKWYPTLSCQVDDKIQHQNEKHKEKVDQINVLINQFEEERQHLPNGKLNKLLRFEKRT